MYDLLSAQRMASIMGDSKFCLVPRGRAAWSVRFFETLWSGCVPVILSDHFEIPFEPLFDVSEFAIKWPVARVAELYAYLKSVPDWRIERMLRAAERVRCWYYYVDCSAGNFRLLFVSFPVLLCPGGLVKEGRRVPGSYESESRP